MRQPLAEYINWPLEARNRETELNRLFTLVWRLKGGHESSWSHPWLTPRLTSNFTSKMFATSADIRGALRSFPALYFILVTPPLHQSLIFMAILSWTAASIPSHPIPPPPKRNFSHKDRVHFALQSMPQAFCQPLVYMKTDVLEHNTMVPIQVRHWSASPE